MEIVKKLNNGAIVEGLKKVNDSYLPAFYWISNSSNEHKVCKKKFDTIELAEKAFNKAHK